MVTQQLGPLSLEQCLHPSERSRFWLAVGVVAPVTLVAATLALPIMVFVLPTAILFAWFATRLMRARLLGNCVEVSADNFPKVYELLVEIRSQVDYQKHVEVFVYQEGEVNAFLLRRFRTRIVLLPHELLVDTLDGRHQQELVWILARAVGHLKAKHLRLWWLALLIESIEKLALFNLFLYPWERATQYSGDRIGLAVCGDLHAATRALRKLMLGNALADRASIGGLLAQRERLQGSFFGWLSEAFSAHPIRQTGLHH